MTTKAIHEPNRITSKKGQLTLAYPISRLLSVIIIGGSRMGRTTVVDQHHASVVNHFHTSIMVDGDWSKRAKNGKGSRYGKRQRVL